MIEGDDTKKIFKTKEWKCELDIERKTGESDKKCIIQKANKKLLDKPGYTKIWNTHQWIKYTNMTKKYAGS